MEKKNTPTVFVVDDDESVCSSLKRLLKVSGYRVEVFQSAQSFLDSVLPEQQGCLILDIHMPNIGGLSFFDQLAGLRYRLPIIFITGQAQAEDRQRVMEKGAIGYLQKPFQKSSLFELISKAFNNE